MHSYPNYMIAVQPAKEEFNKISFSNPLKTPLDLVLFSAVLTLTWDCEDKNRPNAEYSKFPALINVGMFVI